MSPDEELELSKLSREESGIRRPADGSTEAFRRVAHGTAHPGRYLRHPRSDRSAGCPIPGDFSLRGTTPQHKTHQTELRKVQYPWHPLFGREVLVRGAQRKHEAAMYRCHIPGKERRNCFEIPQWMFDSAVCSRMRVTESPHVCSTALQTLKQLLEETSTAPRSSVIEAQHRSLSDKGGADAQSSTKLAARPAEPVPSRTESPTVEIVPGGDPGGCGTTVDAAASRPSEASAPRSRRRRGRR